MGTEHGLSIHYHTKQNPSDSGALRFSHFPMSHASVKLISSALVVMLRYLGDAPLFATLQTHGCCCCCSSSSSSCCRPRSDIMMKSSASHSYCNTLQAALYLHSTDAFLVSHNVLPVLDCCRYGMMTWNHLYEHTTDDVYRKNSH